MAPANYTKGSAFKFNSHQTPPLPEKLRCDRCTLLKPHMAFAKNRIDYAKRTGIKNRETSKQLICTQCTGSPTGELWCHGCHRVKGLDAFSRNQRSTPDSAKCRICVHEIETTEPGNVRDEDDNQKDAYDAYGGGHGSLREILARSAANTGPHSTIGPPQDEDGQGWAVVRPALCSSGRAPVPSRTATHSLRSSTGGVNSSTMATARLTNNLSTSRDTDSRWAKTPAVPREIPKPQDEDEDNAVASDNDDGDWEM